MSGPDPTRREARLALALAGAVLRERAEIRHFHDGAADADGNFPDEGDRLMFENADRQLRADRDLLEDFGVDINDLRDVRRAVCG
ncbi:MAG: hypothetical protein OXF74_02630 [Rhodobacteraceae bacterium]|nr:hypothetical protein [Paracoccaceae bacterium]